MFRRIVAVAGIAGVVTGVLLTGIQLLGVLPLIEVAEGYERQASWQQAAASEDALPPSAAASSAAPPAAAAYSDHDGFDGWQGWKRVFWTATANIGASFGFALLLVTLLFLRGRDGWSQGLLLGAIGFVVFFLNPSLGVPPQIPGAHAIGLVAHQWWWLGTVALSSIAAALLVLTKTLWPKVAGVLLLLLPHLLGAPQREAVYSGAAPEALAHSFVTAVSITNGVFWLMLGLISAFLYQYQRRKPQ